MEPIFTSKMKRKMVHGIMGIFLSASMVFLMLSAGEMTVYATEGLLLVSNDFDFSSAASNLGDLDTEGYHWDVGSKTLQLKNINISGTVTLPDDAEVTIETTGDCSIDTLSAGPGPDKAQLIFTGTGKLTIEQPMNINGGDYNIITVANGAYVMANGGINIGASGGVNSTVTVYGTLTAKGASFAISAGKVVVGSGGLLEVSGKQGVLLNGMSTGSSYSVADVFTVQEGGCFTANCEEYNVKVAANPGDFPPDSNADQAFHIPEGYLPTDCEVKQEGGEINLVKKSTGEVYTGALTIHENHKWPEGWNKRNEFGHWKECTLEGCDKTKGYEAHSYDNDTGECVCGSTLTVTLNTTEELIYNGQEKKPDVTVTVDGTTLDTSKYNIAYSDNINAGEASVTVTGNGDLHFNRTVKFQITKASSTITWGSPAQTVTYSGSQVTIVPPTVTLVNGGDFHGEIQYSYAVEGSSNYTSGLPTNIGTYTIKASIPEQGNYNATDGTDVLTLIVEQAENAPNMPSDVMNVEGTCEKVSDVELPAGWQWQEADKNTALEMGIPLTATAVYVGADRANYKNVTVTVTITRANDAHENTTGHRNADADTDQKKDNSLDTYPLKYAKLPDKETLTEPEDQNDGTDTKSSDRVKDTLSEPDSEDLSSGTPEKSPDTDVEDKIQQTGQPWWILLVVILVILIGIFVFLVVKRKKEESDS